MKKFELTSCNSSIYELDFREYFEESAGENHQFFTLFHSRRFPEFVFAISSFDKSQFPEDDSIVNDEIIVSRFSMNSTYFCYYIDEQVAYSIDDFLISFENWLLKDLAPYIHEKTGPDLWEMDEGVFTPEKLLFSKIENDPLSLEEKLHFQSSLDFFDEKLITSGELLQDQIDVLRKEVDELKIALKTSGKKDYLQKFAYVMQIIRSGYDVSDEAFTDVKKVLREMVGLDDLPKFLD
ncbi:MAG: hypothetical protein RIF33_26825 [Cyclobacteriaceae bacterium]